MRNAREMSEKILTLKGIMSPDLLAILESIEDPGHLADLVAANLRLKIDEAQLVLEEMDPIRSLIKVNDFLRKEMEVSAIQAKIQNQAREEMDRTQREYFLREQLRAIKKELGDLDETSKEMEEYRLKINRARMPKEAEEEAVKQLVPPGADASRRRRSPPSSAPTWTGWCPCPGARAPGTSWRSKKPRRSWMRTISTWKRSRTASWST